MYVTASILISLQRTYVYKSFLLICTVNLSTVFGRRQCYVHNGLTHA